MSDIEQRVRKIIVENLGVDESEVMNSASFVEDLGAESLDSVELVMAFEDEFEVEFSEEDAEKLDTVQKVIDYIQNKKS